MPFDFRGIFGSRDSAQQLFVWGVLYGVVAALGSPVFTGLRQLANSQAPIEALSVADAVDAVIKDHLSRQQGAGEAERSGIDNTRFDTLVANAGEPPGLEFLLEAFRRQFIPEAGSGAESVSLEQGIRESRLKNKWIETVEKMAIRPIPASDAVEAVLKGQIERGLGEQIAYFSGLDRDSFEILFNSAGNPPTPSELAELLKRGFIPLEGVGPHETSFQQGIFEGRSKDKWWPLFAKLADYIPPPRTVTAMVREGALTDEQALGLFKQAGLSDQLAGAYLTASHHQKTSTHRDINVTEILSLYRDRLVDRTEAGTMLKLHRFSDGDVAFLLDLADFQALQAKVRSAVNRIHNLYVNHKIDSAQASQTLDGLGVPATGRDEMLTIWNLERAAEVPRLTRAEIVDAWFYGILSDSEADQRLEAYGWTPEEAAILRGIRAHGRQRPAVRP